MAEWACHGDGKGPNPSIRLTGGAKEEMIWVRTSH
jgi:hypothetical protein